MDVSPCPLEAREFCFAYGQRTWLDECVSYRWVINVSVESILVLFACLFVLKYLCLLEDLGELSDNFVGKSK